MKLIGTTLRIDNEMSYDEKRDALDQRWYDFLNKCHLTPLLLPNHLETIDALLKIIKLDGILLTGGNDAPERKAAEFFLIDYAIKHKLPLLGICHGMQIIQTYFDISLVKVENHIQSQQEIYINKQPSLVNSFHQFGTTETLPELAVWGVAKDGVIKAVRHVKHAITAIMWHPERMHPYHPRDLKLFCSAFNGDA